MTRQLFHSQRPAGRSPDDLAQQLQDVQLDSAPPESPDAAAVAQTGWPAAKDARELSRAKRERKCQRMFIVFSVSGYMFVGNLVSCYSSNSFFGALGCVLCTVYCRLTVGLQPGHDVTGRCHELLAGPPGCADRGQQHWEVKAAHFLKCFRFSNNLRCWKK